MADSDSDSVPHVIMLSWVTLGHVRPMFNLAQLLSKAGLSITLVNTEPNHRDLVRTVNLPEFQRQHPNIQLLTIPDGLPHDDQPRGGLMVGALSTTSPVRAALAASFRAVVLNHIHELKNVKCIIADMMMSFAVDIAEEFQVGCLLMGTYCATSIWVFRHFSALKEAGLVPLPEGQDLDTMVTCIPGLENTLRRRDLPSMCRFAVQLRAIEFFIEEHKRYPRASGILLNTFEDLESLFISKLDSNIAKVYSVGPIDDLHKSEITSTESDSVPSIYVSTEEYGRCFEWLDSKPPKSVLYVSFGSVVKLSNEQLLEFWHGLVNSGSFFLWAIRSDLMIDNNDLSNLITPELEQGTKERGCIVSWAPQKKVLAHKAIGGFMTHSGWNSILESISAGVPMICWAFVSEQFTNAMCVREMWKIGFDIKDKSDRLAVETSARRLMENKNDEVHKSAEKMAELARKSVQKGGQSYLEFERLVDDIRKMSSAVCSNGGVMKFHE